MHNYLLMNLRFCIFVNFYTVLPYFSRTFFFAFFRDCVTDVMCCRFNPDGQHLAVGLIDGSVKVRNIFLKLSFHSSH